MTTAYVGFGSNLGDRQKALKAAVKALNERCGTIASMSSLWETQHVSTTPQPDFLNGVFCIETCLGPRELLETCLGIEDELGRKRKVHMAPRRLDLDILYYGTWIIRLPRLTVPHPRIRLRRFVLEPLAEIAPEWADPLLLKTSSFLLRECPDRHWARRVGSL
jgi:2-amino-4-hydroxy-6-hydroxymethyldihydropteridine diphosphokinase